MISRRNFFNTCLIMAIILILFQFSVLSRDFVNDYDENVFLTEMKLTGESAWNEQSANDTTQTVVYIGSENDAPARIIRQWCRYTKRCFAQCDSLENYVRPENGNTVLLCLTRETVTSTAQADALSSMVQEGQNVLFCDMPEAENLTWMSSLRNLLGIKKIVQDEVELTGIKLFPGFLLGGEVIYSVEEEEEKLDQEIHISAPWYKRTSGTKSYMIGMLEDEDVENEDLPSLIWRNSHGKGRVFVVNGPYMQDETGLGVLSAIMYELKDYDIYPVVNAQSLSVASFPDFALENTENMTKIYERNMKQLQMNLLWPGIIASANKGNYNMTCFFAPQLDYTTTSDLLTDDLTFYLKQFREQNAEAGLSFDHLAGVSLEDKLIADQAFFNASNNAYSYGSAYVGSDEKDAFLTMKPLGITKNIRTITGVWEDEDVLSYCTDNIVAQGVTANGFTHPYQQDLRIRAIETSLAYSNILLDMKRISWPEEDDPHWEILSERFSSNINTYWNKFTVFDKTTLLESDERTRAFFALDYNDIRTEDTVTLGITRGVGDHWFILRTHDESIEDIVGGDYVEIEKDVYLIHTAEKNLQIELKERQNKQYYLP